MKRLLSLILALAMLSGAAAFAEQTELSVEFELDGDAEVLPPEDVEAVEAPEAVEAAEPEEAAAPLEDVWLEGDDGPAEANAPAEMPNLHYDGSRYVTFTRVDGATDYRIGNNAKGGLFPMDTTDGLCTITGDTYKVDLKTYMNQVQVESGTYQVTLYAYAGTYYAIAQSTITYSYVNDMPSLETPLIWWEGTVLHFTAPEHATYANCIVDIYAPDGILMDFIGFNGTPEPIDYDITKEVPIIKDCLYKGKIRFSGTGYRDVSVETPMMTGEELLSNKKKLTGAITELYTDDGKFLEGREVKYKLSGAVQSLKDDVLKRRWQVSEDGESWTDTGRTGKTYTIEAGDKYLRLQITAEGYTGELISPSYLLDDEAKQYTITVYGGTASKLKASKGESVTLTADPPKSGMQFENWTIAKGGGINGVRLPSNAMPTVTFTMPAKDVAFRANFTTAVNEFDVLLAQPLSGATPPVPGTMAEQYRLGSYHWTDEETGNEVSETGVLIGGRTYVLTMTLVMTEGIVGDWPVCLVNGGKPGLMTIATQGTTGLLVKVYYDVEKNGNAPQPPEVISPDNPQNATGLDYTLMAKDDEEDALGASFSLLRAKAGSGKNYVKLSWKAVPGATVYAVYANRCGTGNTFNYIDGTSATSFKLTGLKKGTYYKAIVMAVDDSGSALAMSQNIHVATTGGKVGNHTKVAMGKGKFTLAAGQTKKVKATLKRGSKKVKIHRKLAWESDDVRVATVDGKGNITAVAPGKCTVYAYAQNGVAGKCVVTVK